MEMNFEGSSNSRKKESLPLSEEDAMNEAATLKAAIAIKRKGVAELGGKAYRDGMNRAVEYYYNSANREPTAADYEYALETVQQLKQLAQNEPDSKKAMFKMGRVLYNTARLGAIPVMILDTLMTTFVSNFDSESRPDWAGYLTRDMLDTNKDIMEFLTDAEKKLQILEKQARIETKKDIRDNKEREQRND